MIRLTRKILILTVITSMVFFGTSVMSQDLQTAIKLTKNEQFESANEMFKTLIQKEPNNGEYYFYWGENYFLSEAEETAVEKYKTGIEKDPNQALNYVGLGKYLLMNKNQQEALASFDKARTFIPKKPTMATLEKLAIIYIKIAEAYFNVEKVDTGKIMPMLINAETLDKKNPNIYLLRGDAYYSVKNWNLAIENYKKAQDVDPKSPRAKMKIGKIYQGAKNYDLAINFYNDAVTIDSTFAPAYRELGELYSMAGKYNKAKEYYKKFVMLSSKNVYAKTRYASFLFLTKDYQETITQILEIFESDTVSYNYLNRLIGYSYFETKEYAKGLVYMQKFFRHANAKKILTSDYLYYGRLFINNGKDSLGVEQLWKGFKNDSSNLDLLKEISSSYLKMKKYEDAARTYEKKIELTKPKVDANDYYDLGKAYYSAQKWDKADTAFAIVVKEKPDFLKALLFRAYCNMNIGEAKEGKAVPYYEMFIEKAMAEKDTALFSKSYKNDVIKSNQYIASYFYVTMNDKCKSKQYFEKMLALDPKNEISAKMLADIKKRNCK